MEFDFTQMSRTLRKVLVGIGFESVIWIILEGSLSEHSHLVLMGTKVESDLLEPKWKQGRDMIDR